MDLWRSLSGMVILDLTSADVTESMRCINDSGIRIFGAVAKDALTMRFQIHRRDYRSLCRLCKVRGDRIQISGHRGIYWGLKGVLHRSVLLTGVMILLVASFWIPSRVFFVRVEGNQRIPQKVILEAAEACGLTFGADRSKVRSERMKNALLERIPELQWTGINTTGCTAVISVRERSETTTGEGRGGVSSIVASTDGVISELTVLRGTPLCRVGQAVKAGQILVSGYTDCGLTIRAEQAAAEIFAKTNRRLTVIVPKETLEKAQSSNIEKKYSLIIGKKRINLFKGSGILDTTCDKMYSETYLLLPGGFQLPIALATEQWIYRESASTVVDKSAASEQAAALAEAYLKGHMTAGQILRRHTQTLDQDDAVCLHGNYECLEMIGRTRIEESLPDYAQAD